MNIDTGDQTGGRSCRMADGLADYMPSLFIIGVPFGSKDGCWLTAGLYQWKQNTKLQTIKPVAVTRVRVLLYLEPFIQRGISKGNPYLVTNRELYIDIIHRA